MKKSTLILCLLLAVIVPAFSQTKPVSLVCENMNNPLGIETMQPRFGWNFTATVRNVMQVSYRIIVADDVAKILANTGNIWDSKQVTSDQSLWVPYAGKPLQASKLYYWKVQVWDNQSNNSPEWSDTASFQMGLLQPADWSNAQWIGYDELDAAKRYVPGVHAPGANKDMKAVVSGNHVLPILRKSFSVSKPVRRATAFISGLGQYELHINGNKIGDRFLTPGWTNYDKRCFYNTYDVTPQVANGNNAIGVMLGNGFYNVPNERYRKALIAYGNPKMIMKLLVEYTDGTKTEVISDNTWKVAQSPITFSSIYAGEEYNAALEQDGWDKAGFNDGAWKAAMVVKAPTGKLEAEMGTPVMVMHTISPVTVKHTSDTTYLYDFGQNASGIVHIQVKGRKGQMMKFYPAELIDKNKRANQKASGKPFYFSYTCKGTGVEDWQPRFSYYGFRYVEVVNAAPDTTTDVTIMPTIVDMKMLHTRNSATPVGKFGTMDDLMGDTYTLIDWAIRSNMQSVLTDCPHREKLGWLEESYLMGESVHFNYDVYGLYKKIVGDMMADQTADGLVPDIAPEYVMFDGGFRDSPEWGSASVILPWLIYQWYGDKTVMQDAWPMMTKYVNYLKSKASGNILSHGLGDWYDLGPKFPGVAQLTPKELTATAIYYYDITILAKVAKALGKSADVAQWNTLAAEVKTAFNTKFYNAQTSSYATGSQTSIAMPLAVGLVDEANKPAVVNALLESIKKSDNKLTAGDVGFHFLVKALTDNKKDQELYDMVSSDKSPGYAFQLKKGATALTESWAALEEVSNNHLMLGHLMEWFFNGLGGIHRYDTSVAYKTFEIKPEPVIKSHVSYQSPYGIIYTEWDNQYAYRVLTVYVPVNTTAIVYVPASPTATIMESNSPISLKREIKSLGNENGRAIFKIGSGRYKFLVK